MPPRKKTAAPTKPVPSLAKAIAKSAPAAAPHLIVRARAGTGKTTTLVEGLRYIKGETPKITPSPQQKAVWDSMLLSKGVSTMAFVAFNRKIAEELERRVPQGCEAMTMHRLGNRTVSAAFGKLRMSEYRVDDLIATEMDIHPRDLRSEWGSMVYPLKRLVSLCKMNLIDWQQYEEIDPIGLHEILDALVAEQDIDLDKYRTMIYGLVPKILKRCADPLKDFSFDYDDMVWLPVALNLPIPKVDLLLVDEAQDLNKCQQELAMRAGRRLIFCGDDRQAIYGFAGADSQSLPNLHTRLTATKEGCQLLPLTVTRRCGKAIVEEAKTIVPDFEAHESNHEGKVTRMPFRIQDDGVSPPQANLDYRSSVQQGDMIVCRCNGPLVSECFRFIKQGRAANIQGRDIGTGLTRLIDKLTGKKPETKVPELVTLLSDWLDAEVKKESAKRFPSEGRLITLQDKYDCLLVFTDGQQTAGDVIARIHSIFTDKDDAEVIKLSSIHKAKGLEAKRVFFIQPEKAQCPHPMAKTKAAIEQEFNLRYVAITRAIIELVHVT